MVTIQGTIGASAQVGRTEGMDNKLKEHSNWKMLDRQSVSSPGKRTGSYGVLLKEL